MPITPAIATACPLPGNRLSPAFRISSSFRGMEGDCAGVSGAHFKKSGFSISFCYEHPGAKPSPVWSSASPSMKYDQKVKSRRGWRKMETAAGG